MLILPGVFTDIISFRRGVYRGNAGADGLLVSKMVFLYAHKAFLWLLF